jgi:hypothetical protein
LEKINKKSIRDIFDNFKLNLVSEAQAKRKEEEEARRAIVEEFGQK